MQSYRDLIVWQKSIDLVAAIYQLTESFPKAEIYGLTSQMRRAAVSIPSNIAEGYTRKHRPEYVQFARIAFGSGAELETQLVISRKLQFAFSETAKPAEDLLSEVMAMLNALCASLSK